MEQEQRQQRIAVIEVLGRDGHPRLVQRIAQWPARIGRAPRCEVVLDDAHLAAEHAQLHWDEQGPARLEMLASLNGGWLGDQRLQSGQSVDLGESALLQLGTTHLRWRRESESLPPELPMQQHQQRAAKVGAAWLPALLLLWIGLLWFDQWSALNPGAPWIDYSAAVLWPLIVLVAWSAAWALVTQVFQHRFPWGTHLRRALIGVTGLHLVALVLPLLAYAFSMPRLMVVDALAFPCGIAALLWWHASLVWPRARRGLALALGAVLLTLLVLTVARRQEQQHWLGPAYLSSLPPPTLRVAEPKPVQALLDALRPLEAELARQANKDNDKPSEDMSGED